VSDRSWPTYDVCDGEWHGREWWGPIPRAPAEDPYRRWALRLTVAAVDGASVGMDTVSTKAKKPSGIYGED